MAAVVALLCASPRAAADASVAGYATVLRGDPAQFAPLLDSVRDKRFVLLGEMSHGTHEFYRARAEISLSLSSDAGVRAVVIEADAPETERVNLYVRGLGGDRTAEQALSGYTRFPRWMWRNVEFRDFVEALRKQNLQRPPEDRTGVYGMDVYALFNAIEAVNARLQRVDPEAAARVRRHYACFAGRRTNEGYGLAARNPARSCEAPAAAALAEVRRLPRPTDPAGAEVWFSNVRNAASVVGAEAYYRASYAGAYSWNVRDRRMAETVTEVADHVGAVSGRSGKVVVWAHNTHVGDARATAAARRGELNLGQLLRERHGSSTFLVGFLTAEGSVVAAEEWDRPGRVRRLRPAASDSWSGLLRRSGLDRALLMFDRRPRPEALGGSRRERAVGVIYLPAEERTAHYFDAELTRQFDAVIYLDRTRALEALR